MKRTNVLHKIISVIVTVMVVINTFAVPVFAASVTSGNNGRITIIDKGFQISDDTANDWVKFRDVDGEIAILKVVVNIDNTSKMILEKEGRVCEIQGTNIDYQKYIYDLVHPNPDLTHGISLYGREITGKQYKHIRIGSSSILLDTDDILSLTFIGVSAIIGKIYQLGVGASAALDIASFAQSKTINAPKTMRIISVGYEVYSKDHLGKFTNYYTHCYHVEFLTYDSGGHLIDASSDYYQAIGG